MRRGFRHQHRQAGRPDQVKTSAKTTPFAADCGRQGIGGAPPPAGPARLRFNRGDRVRFRIYTDAPLGIEIPGYGISETVESGTVVSFRADRVGQFPVIVASSHIGIAGLQVSP